MGLAAFSYLFMLFKSTLFSKKSILRFVEVLCIITVVSSLYYENNLIEYKTADELNTGRYLGVQSEQFPSPNNNRFSLAFSDGGIFRIIRLKFYGKIHYWLFPKIRSP